MSRRSSTPSLTGKVAVENVSLVVGSAKFASKNVGTWDVTGGSLALAGADKGNYTLGTVTAAAKATIKLKELTGSFTVKDKVYDGNDVAEILDTSLTGKVAVENVSLVVGSAKFASKDVGRWDVTGALSLSGVDAGNYAVNTPYTTKASITAWNADGRGFYQPVGVANSTFIPAGSTPQLPAATSTTVWNVAKGGSTIPLKFNVFAGTVEKTSTSDISGFTAVKLTACATGSSEDVVEFVTSGNTVLRYEHDRQAVHPELEDADVHCRRVLPRDGDVRGWLDALGVLQAPPVARGPSARMAAEGSDVGGAQAPPTSLWAERGMRGWPSPRPPPPRDARASHQCP